jgi:hypothetical protein
MKKENLLFKGAAFTLCVLMLLVFTSSYGQEKQFLRLKSGTYEVENNVKDFVFSPNFSDDELVNDNYYRIVQFKDIPSLDLRNQLLENGINLMGYLPDKAYYAEINISANLSLLLSSNVTSVLEIEENYKLSDLLLKEEYPSWAVFPDNEIGIIASFYESIPLSEITQSLGRLNATQIEFHSELVVFRISKSNLSELYNSPHFYYFEALEPPPVPEGYDDVSDHRSNYLNNPLGVGKGYTGAGVVIMMQDDGPIGPHIDYQGRTVTETSSNFGDHGDHVGGIIMGAGNLDPDGVGNAPGATLLVYSSANGNYDDVPELYDTANMVITSKSYGDGNNAGYTTRARTLDKQCRERDALIHVFSAGNSGTEDFGYGAGSGWGNITGGHKQAKNVLAVGNLNNIDVLSSSSSRGPADDGRIKPDICGVGTNVYSTIDVNTYENKSGTSMSCPGVAGSIALLYEAYRDLNSGQNPSAALINGAVLNTAKDLGNPGPDFKYGWGRINTKRAYELIESGNYQNGEIVQSGNNSHTINVPANTKEFRVMIYWTDYEGSVSSSTALVNDINMTMTGPDASVYQPWVLNPAPSAPILNQNAVPGTDDLNNVEQITIEDPLAGNYTVNLEGFNIPQGPQAYYITYEFVEDEITVVYPIGDEHFVPSTGEIIRWDAVGDDGDFKIEYSLDAGDTWNLITNIAPGNRRSFPWSISSSIVSSGKARVKVSRNGLSGESKENFDIIGTPGNLNVEWACSNSFNFSWTAVNGAIGYQVYLLGENYMDSAGYSSTTNATVYANSMETQWVSVCAIGPDGAIGKRAVALRKTPGVFGCTLSPPIAGFTSICNETGSGSCVRFIDQSTNAGQGAAWEWTFQGGNPATSNLEQPKICYDTEGIYDVQLIVRNGVGDDAIHYSGYVTIVDGKALPFIEDFESGLVPQEWTITNDGNGQDWELAIGTSAYEEGINSIKFDNFNGDTIGIVSSFQTEQIDLSENVVYDLSFDLAYAQGVSTNDTLYVYASNDCGDSKELIFKMGGSELATASSSGVEFIPSAVEWIRYASSLESMLGNTSVSFIFENHSYQGNTVYVDNINVLISEANYSDSEITVFPNPFGDEINVSGLIPGEEAEIRIIASNGEIVLDSEFTDAAGMLVISTRHIASGVYVIQVKSPSRSHKQKLVKIK